MSATLLSRINSLTHQRDWFVLTDHADAVTYGDVVSGYFPRQGGEASYTACETWLADRGFRRNGDMPPEIFEYTA